MDSDEEYFYKEFMESDEDESTMMKAVDMVRACVACSRLQGINKGTSSIESE